MLANPIEDGKIFFDLIKSEVGKTKAFAFFKKSGLLTYLSKEGLKFNLRTGVHDSSVIIENYWFKGYWRFINSDREDRNQLIIDIGGHIGLFCVLAATKFKNAKVLAYEPNPESFELLRQNIETNNLEGRVIPFNLAVSSGNGKNLIFKVDNNDTGRCYTQETEGAEGVASISLREIINNNQIKSCDLLKIDCEGYELPIIKSLNSEQFSIIKKIVIECHNQFEIPIIQDILKNNGFAVKTYKVIENNPIAILWNSPLIAAWKD
jgi:FkbM family methyltransferase